GTTEEVYHDPVNRFVAGVLGGSNFIRAHVGRGEPDGVGVARGPGGTELRGRAGGAGQGGGARTRPLRPERLRVATAGASRVNHARGRVAEVIFKGSSLRYHVWLSEDCRCAVAQQNSSDEHVVGRGQDVIVEWAAEDCLVLRNEQGGIV